MATVKFVTEDAVLRAAYERVAAHIKNVDAALRSTPLLGEPVEKVKVQASGALNAAGVDLPDEMVAEYAQSLSDGDDYEFVLT
jgi:hypothetical protein